MRAPNVQGFSLRTKLVTFAAALVIVPGIIYGVLAVSSAERALTRVVGRELAEEARSAADRFATTLRSGRDRIDAAARQDVMREIRIGDLDKRISSFLVSVERGDTACGQLLVLDRAGRVIASNVPAAIGGAPVPAPPPERDGIDGPIATSADAVRHLRFTATIPDPDDPRHALGRLVAVCAWDHATDVLERVRTTLAAVGLATDVALVDDRGIVIGGALRTEGSWRTGAPIPLRAWRDSASVGPPVGHVDDAAGVLFGRAALPIDLPPWTIVVAQPLREAIAPARRTGRLLAATLGAVLVVALATTLVAARRVTRPLAQLTAAAEAMGRGGSPPPLVAVASRDEIGTLAGAFNRMAVDLQRAEKELVDAAKFAFVGELAAGVAHEVRTPLGVMRSSTQLLERSLPTADAEVRELLQLLRDEVDRIDRVVTGLLDLGRPRELALERASLAEIVARAAEFAEPQAREKGVVLRRGATADPVVRCDPELMYQVALNLIVNAIQVVPAGSAVEVAVAPAANGTAAFEVRDEGPGVADDVRELIFLPFFTRRNGGAGLGLTFVRRVVQEHRGRVTVTSGAGGGAVFRVELPAAETAPEDAA